MIHEVDAAIATDSKVGTPAFGPAVYPTVQDFGTNNYTGTMVNMGPSAIEAVSAGGVSTHSIHWTNQTNAWVDFGEILKFETTEAFSLSFWIKKDYGTFQGYPISNHASTGGGTGWSVYVYYSGVVRFLFWSSTGVSIRAESTAIVADSGWHHVACTYDGSGNQNGMRVYIDNVVQPTPISKAITGSLLTAGNLLLGHSNDGVTELDAWLDDFAVFDKALSAGEVSTIYNSGVPTDLTLSGISNLEAYWRLGEALLDVTAASLNYAINASPTADSLVGSDVWMGWGAYSTCGAEALFGPDAGVNFALDAGLLADSMGSSDAGVNFALDASLLADSDQTAWVFAEWTLVAGCMADSACAGDANMLFACWAAMPANSGFVCPGFDKTYHAPAPANPVTRTVPTVRVAPPTPVEPRLGVSSSTTGRRPLAPTVQTPIRRR